MDSNRRHNNWLLPLLLLAVLIGVIAVRAWQPATTQYTAPVDESAGGQHAKLVELAIDVGDGLPRECSGAWRPGMTVQDALATASDVDYSVQGRGGAAFLTELAGLPNEGPGGRNWQFEVNGQWSDRSMGVHELQPGDSVLWKFEASE